MGQNKSIIVGVAVAALVLIAAGIFYFSSQGNGAGTAAPNGMADAPEALVTPGPLGDLALGDEDAPVTIIEYASLTCNHCAAFHTQVFPELKEKYIETGKVRFVARAFPLDPIATAAVMISRCAGDDRYFKFLEILFAKQHEWAFQENPVDKLKAIAKQGGFSDESFEQCLADPELLDHIRQVQKRAYEELKIASTPTFFVNGEKVEGAMPFEDFEKIILKHLSES